MSSPTIQRLAPILVGGVLGGGVAWGIAPQAGPEMPPQTPAVVVLGQPLPVSCPERKDALEEERARLELELEGIALQLKIGEHRRLAREGEEAPWPDAPDPMQVSATFKANIEASLSEIGGELLEMECDEYPCIVAVAVPKLDEVNGVAGNAMDELFAGLNERGYLDHETVWMTTGDVDNEYISIFAVRGPEDDGISGKRTTFRAERFGEETFERLRDVAEEP
jgi:hypothetical protein